MYLENKSCTAEKKSCTMGNKSCTWSVIRHEKSTFWFRRHNFETIYGSSITVGEAVKSINFYMYHSSDKVVDVLKLGKMYIIKLQKVVFIVVFAILAKL